MSFQRIDKYPSDAWRVEGVDKYRSNPTLRVDSEPPVHRQAARKTNPSTIVTGGHDGRGTYVANNRVRWDEIMDSERGSVDGTLTTDVYCLRNAVIAEGVIACASRAWVDEW